MTYTFDIGDTREDIAPKKREFRYPPTSPWAALEGNYKSKIEWGNTPAPKVKRTEADVAAKGKPVPMLKRQGGPSRTAPTAWNRSGPDQ